MVTVQCKGAVTWCDLLSDFSFPRAMDKNKKFKCRKSNRNVVSKSTGVLFPSDSLMRNV